MFFILTLMLIYSKSKTETSEKCKPKTNSNIRSETMGGSWTSQNKILPGAYINFLTMLRSLLL